MNHLNMDIVFVRPLKDRKLFIEFDNGECRLLDLEMSYKDKGSVFQEVIKDRTLFDTVKLDAIGTICWDNGLDIAVESIYANSRSIV